MAMRTNAKTGRLRQKYSVTLLPIVAVLMIFGAIACSGSSSDSSEPDSAEATAPSTAATVTQSPPTVAPTATAVTPDSPTPTQAPSPTEAPIVEPTATPSPLGGEFFLTLIEPADIDVFSESSTLDVIGQTRIDAVVTVNDDIVTPDSNGDFEHTVTLEEGINVIEVVGSVSAEEQLGHVITVVYLP